ncbi:hypothetical protein CYMTET_32482, partial [Cymbomonas tetramitiformis]
ASDSDTDLEAAAARRAADLVKVLSDLGGSMVQGAVADEDAVSTHSPTMAITTGLARADLPDSTLYSAPVGTGDGSLNAVQFPESIGLALASAAAAARRRRLLQESIALDGDYEDALYEEGDLLPPQEISMQVLTTTSEMHTSNTSAPGYAASGAAAVESASGVQQVVLGAAGEELEVSNLEEAIEIVMQLKDGQAESRRRRLLSGDPTGRLECRFWSPEKDGYDSEGCVTLPNPAPAGAQLRWRTKNMSSIADISLAWEVGNATMARGCEERFDAVLDPMVWDGADAGFRKWVAPNPRREGSYVDYYGCELIDNSTDCYWKWTAGMFVGESCVTAPALSCLCTHLTDFKAPENMEVGEAEPPQLSFPADQMLQVSLGDLLKSAVLLGICFGLIGFASLWALNTGWSRNAERQQILTSLIEQSGTGIYGFKDFGGTWTWSIFEEDRIRGIKRLSERLRRQQRNKMAELNEKKLDERQDKLVFDIAHDRLDHQQRRAQLVMFTQSQQAQIMQRSLAARMLMNMHLTSPLVELQKAREDGSKSAIEKAENIMMQKWTKRWKLRLAQTQLVLDIAHARTSRVDQRAALATLNKMDRKAVLKRVVMANHLKKLQSLLQSPLCQLQRARESGDTSLVRQAEGMLAKKCVKRWKQRAGLPTTPRPVAPAPAPSGAGKPPRVPMHMLGEDDASSRNSTPEPSLIARSMSPFREAARTMANHLPFSLSRSPSPHPGTRSPSPHSGTEIVKTPMILDDGSRPGSRLSMQEEVALPLVPFDHKNRTGPVTESTRRAGERKQEAPESLRAVHATLTDPASDAAAEGKEAPTRGGAVQEGSALDRYRQRQASPGPGPSGALASPKLPHDEATPEAPRAARPLDCKSEERDPSEDPRAARESGVPWDELEVPQEVGMLQCGLLPGNEDSVLMMSRGSDHPSLQEEVSRLSTEMWMQVEKYNETAVSYSDGLRVRLKAPGESSRGLPGSEQRGSPSDEKALVPPPSDASDTSTHRARELSGDGEAANRPGTGASMEVIPMLDSEADSASMAKLMSLLGRPTDWDDGDEHSRPNTITRDVMWSDDEEEEEEDFMAVMKDDLQNQRQLQVSYPGSFHEAGEESASILAAKRTLQGAIQGLTPGPDKAHLSEDRAHLISQGTGKTVTKTRFSIEQFPKRQRHISHHLGAVCTPPESPRQSDDDDEEEEEEEDVWGSDEEARELSAMHGQSEGEEDEDNEEDPASAVPKASRWKATKTGVNALAMATSMKAGRESRKGEETERLALEGIRDQDTGDEEPPHEEKQTPFFQRYRERMGDNRRDDRRINLAAKYADMLDPFSRAVLNRYMRSRRDHKKKRNNAKFSNMRRRASAFFSRDSVIAAPSGISDNVGQTFKDPAAVRKRLRIMSVKIICFSRFVRMLQEFQDLHSSKNLCELIGENLTNLAVALPVDAMREMALMRKNGVKKMQVLWSKPLQAMKEQKVLTQQEKVDMMLKTFGAGIGGGGDGKGKKKGGKEGLELPLERMLGTALVLAYLDVSRVVADAQVKGQLNRALEVSWERPTPRHIGWYVDIFKVMLTSNRNTRGWYNRSVLWNLVFLQESDGSFNLTPALATTLAAGDLSPTLRLDATYTIDVYEVKTTLPSVLMDVFKGMKNWDLRLKVWATICALERYYQLPFGWILNPECEPSSTSPRALPSLPPAPPPLLCPRFVSLFIPAGEVKSRGDNTGDPHPPAAGGEGVDAQECAGR